MNRNYWMLFNSFFIRTIDASQWNKLDETKQVEFIRTLTDIREGIGIPVLLKSRLPKMLFIILNICSINQILFFKWGKKNSTGKVWMRRAEVIIEGFISGKEFSCIVIRNENGLPVAFTSDWNQKRKRTFDHCRSKYLPGLSRKITPFIFREHIQQIRKDCETIIFILRI